MSATRSPRSLYDETKREPPDERTRVLMFLSAVDGYANLSEALPLPSSFSFHGAKDDSSYWTIVLHASALRKFFAASEQVHVPKVVGAVRAIVAQPNEDLERHLVDVLDYSDADGVPSSVRLNINGIDVTPWELVQMELYGRHLHVDWSKWVASERRTGGRFALHLSEWVVGADHVVANLAGAIRHFDGEGVIRLNG
jgi:hypothetical protein